MINKVVRTFIFTCLAAGFVIVHLPAIMISGGANQVYAMCILQPELCDEVNPDPDPDPEPVPEPAILALFAGGVAVGASYAFLRHKRRQR